MQKEAQLYCGICKYNICSIADGYCYKYEKYLDKLRQSIKPKYCNTSIEEGGI